MNVPGKPSRAPDMTFFVTTSGPGKGATSAASPGADAYCPNAGGPGWRGGKTWRAYLSTNAGVPAGRSTPAIDRERHVEELQGDVVATSVDDLHGANNKITRETAPHYREGHHGQRRRHAAEPA